ncbi:MAG: RNA polymerase sigma factor [Hyphomonadaceae bacterium]|nr:RNA polymerase sigma factor [Hyphomonadaceae bacterium]
MTGPDEVRFRSELAALLPRLRRFAMVLTGAPAEADDLTQSALERALVRQRQFTPGTRLDSWVFRIAQNLWIDQLRSRKSRGPHADLDAAAAETGQKDEDMADRMDIARTISSLPEDQRAVVGLILVEGWSYQEAAAMLETPVGTVMSRLFRARERIKAALAVGGDVS